MRQENHLARSISEKAQYDANAKEILSDKRLLAWIVSNTVNEFKGYSIEEIMNAIEGDPEIANALVYPNETNRKEKISGLSTEDVSENEGKITYDVRFFIQTKDKKRVKLIINVEAQKDYYPGYDLVTRAIYYCARMISAQLETEFSDSDYNGVKKVYSIWICMNPPEYAKDTITEYKMEQNNIFGNFPDKARYDLLSTVMICIGDVGTNKTELTEVLATIFSGEIDTAKKKEILEREYHFPMSRNLEKGMNVMCNLSEAIEEKGIEKGIEKGYEKGTLKILSDLVNDGTLSVEEAAQKLDITKEEFLEKVKII